MFHVSNCNCNCNCMESRFRVRRGFQMMLRRTEFEKRDGKETRILHVRPRSGIIIKGHVLWSVEGGRTPDDPEYFTFSKAACGCCCCCCCCGEATHKVHAWTLLDGPIRTPSSAVSLAIEAYACDPPAAQTLLYTMTTTPPFVVRVREDGTRHAGCDESSGWVWWSARQLEACLTADPTRMRRIVVDNGDGDDASNDMYMACSNSPPNDDWSQLSILELGAGTGWLALSLATRGAHVTATERHGALALLQQNVLVNQAKCLAWGPSENDNDDDENDEDDAPLNGPSKDRLLLDVDVEELEWSGTKRLPGQWDCMVGSDLLYRHEDHLPLLQTLLRHDCRKCFLTWEERKVKEEATFLVLAQETGFCVEAPVPLTTNPVTGNRIWFVYMTHV
jgi:hypothetical protein